MGHGSSVLQNTVGQSYHVRTSTSGSKSCALLCDSAAADLALQRAREAHGEEADLWRQAAAKALRGRSQKSLVSVALWAQRCRMVRPLPEYADVLKALGAGRNAKSSGEIEAALAKWKLKETPRIHWGDRRGVNLVLRRPLDSDGVLQLFQRVIDQSCQRVGSSDPFMDARDRLGFKVRSVEQVSNMRCWEAYANARGQVAARGKLEPLPSLQMDAKLVSELLQSVLAAGGDLQENANEALLWHGTQPSFVDQIVSSDFQLSRAGSTAGTTFGKGLYFAEAFNKADEYARYPSSEGLRAVLLCRCAVGKYLYVESDLVDGDGGGRKWVKGSEQSSWNVCRVDLEPRAQDGDHDSLIGDRRKMKFNRFREIVILDAARVYPAFIVWYTRKSGRTSDAAGDDAELTTGTAPTASTPTASHVRASGGGGRRCASDRREAWQGHHGGRKS